MVIKHHIRCVLFDLGNTLWMHQEEREHQAIEDAYRRAGSLLHRVRDGEIFAEQDALASGYLVHEAISQRIRTEERRRTEYEPDFALAMMEALRQLGWTEADRELGHAVFEALRVRIPLSRVLFPDTLRTLEVLKQRGYILGVVTNRSYGGQPFHEDLQVMGLLDYFEYQHMAISADLGIRKPHPDIFKHALNGLNVLPEETAMVGDSLEADIGGARRLNILSIWKPQSVVVREKQQAAHSESIVPDVTIEHLQDLLEIF
ncbi:MAG TPA: HAD-IA family hydrolase [Ktedonobacteraceae bacterium]